ncbi:MAG: hypothetical protein H0V90_03925 [Blastocatellia bacterium]|nr:hypothetical protein [Blastocatellia bacterium]
MSRMFLKFLLAIHVVCFSASIGVAQEKDRGVREDSLHRTSPIVVVSRELGDKTFEKQKHVLGERDWLKHLTLGIKNVSDKNIVHFQIDLVIPKQGQMTGPAGVSIFFGRRSAPAITYPGDPTLRPSEAVKVKVTDNDFFRWDKVLKKYGVDDFESVTLDIREVHFEDGTGWKLGIPLQQDPNNHNIWRSLLLSNSVTSSSYWFAMLVPGPLLALYGRSAGLPILPERWIVLPPPSSCCLRRLHLNAVIFVTIATRITPALAARIRTTASGASVRHLMSYILRRPGTLDS